MHFWGRGQQVLGIFNHRSRDWGQSRSDRSREASKAFEQSQRGASVDRNVSCPLSVYFQVCRSLPTILSTLEEVEGVLVGWRMRKSFPGLKEIFDVGTHVDGTGPRGRLVYVSINFWSRCKRRAPERLGSAAPRILYQQDLGRCWDQVPAPGKIGVGVSSRHKKAPPLLSGSYYICIN